MTLTGAATRGFVVSLASPSKTPCGIEMFARGVEVNDGFKRASVAWGSRRRTA